MVSCGVRGHDEHLQYTKQLEPHGDTSPRIMFNQRPRVKKVEILPSTASLILCRGLRSWRKQTTDRQARPLVTVLGRVVRWVNEVLGSNKAWNTRAPPISGETGDAWFAGPFWPDYFPEVRARFESTY